MQRIVMKKTWHNTVVGLLMLLPVGLISCGNETDDNEPDIPKKGSVESELNHDSDSDSTPESDQNVLVGAWRCDDDAKCMFTFTSSGLVVINDNDKNMDWCDSGTYEVSEGTIHTITNNGYEYQDYTFILSDDKLYIKPVYIYGDIDFSVYSRMSGNNIISASSDDANILGAWINSIEHESKDDAGETSYWNEETLLVFYVNGVYREIYRYSGYEYTFIDDLTGTFTYDSKRNRLLIDLPDDTAVVCNCAIDGNTMYLTLEDEEDGLSTVSLERYSGRLH